MKIMKKLSDLHKKIIAEGFEPLGMYSNESFAEDRTSHTTPPFKKIIEERHHSFRILPAQLVYDNLDEHYKNCHVLYVKTGTNSKLELLSGCEPDIDL